jgi:hypothetical protein
MMLNQQQNPGQGNDGRNASHWAMLILRSIAVTVEVFLHRSFGSRYIGTQGFVGVLVILFFGAFVGVPGTGGLMVFLAAYLFACLVARVQIDRRKRRGFDPQHSRYTGWPYLMSIFPRCSELTVKRFIEPVLVVIVAAAVMNAAPALGLYLLMAGGVLFIMVNHDEAEERRRVQNMQDSFIDARDRAERFRSGSGRR